MSSENTKYDIVSRWSPTFLTLFQWNSLHIYYVVPGQNKFETKKVPSSKAEND